MYAYLLISFGLALGVQLALFIVGVRFKSNRLHDVSYIATFVALVVYGLTVTTIEPGKVVLASMVFAWIARVFTFWCLRLHFEGFGGTRVLRSLSLWFVLLPVLLAFRLPGLACDMLSMAGFVVWAVGMAVTSTADWQRHRFSRDPENDGRWMSEGLWRYSRYPHYFGEMLVWLGVYLFVISSMGVIQGLAGAISPLLVLYLLAFDIPHRERKAAARWGKNEAFKLYRAQTSLLLIMPPKA